MAEAPAHRLTLGALLRDTAQTWPGAEALLFPDAELRYAELGARSLEMARALITVGVEPGRHVGVLMNNSPEFVAAFFGAARAGAVVVPVNARLKGAELAYVLRQADLQVLITSDSSAQVADHAGLVAEVLPSLVGSGDPPPPAARRGAGAAPGRDLRPASPRSARGR